jgi:serine/threonine protein kinase
MAVQVPMGVNKIFKVLMEANKISRNTEIKFDDRVIIQTQMSHINIIKLVGCCLVVDVPILVFEFAAKGNLQDILHAHRDSVPLPLDLRLDIAVGCAERLRYMHTAYATDHAIRHGDIRPANIPLDDRLTQKISNFELSIMLLRQTDSQFHADHVAGHRGYSDPVFLQTGLLTLKNDVYSFGVVLMELITRKQNSYTDLPCNLINKFHSVFKHDKWSLRKMFDLEIATKKDIPILEEIGKLAIECVTEDVDDLPDMTEVAQQLMMLRRNRKHGRRQGT